VTFAQIKADVYRRVRYSTSPPSPVVTRIGALINETHRELLSLPGMLRLRDDVIPVTAALGVARSGLPPVVSRIRGIVDRTNHRRLIEVPLEDLRRMDPGQSDSTTSPSRFAVVGYRAVMVQPTAAGGLWAASSSAADVTGPAVFIQSHFTGGYYQADTETLIGTTRVAIGTGTPRVDHEEVTKFYLSTVCAGDVSLYNAAAAGVELARIEAGKTSQHYVTVEWFPIPSAAATLYVDYTRNIPELVDNTDEPLLPPDFHVLLALGARCKEYEMLDDSRVAQARAEYKAGQAALKSYVLNDGEALASLRPRTQGAWSSLGANYPSGS
jgi:hypothetical protein